MMLHEDDIPVGEKKVQYEWYTDITSAIYNFFRMFQEALYPTLPFGAIAYAVIFYTIPFLVIIIFLARRARGGSALPSGVKRIIASTGDVSAGIAGTKKIPFIRDPQSALVFLKIEENAVKQALTAVDYYVQQGEIDESLKEKYSNLYQSRLQDLQTALSSSAELREVIDSSTAVDKARSDYLRKLAAMSGTTVEPDTSKGGPGSVGMPDTSPTEATTTPSAGPPGATAPSDGAAPSGGPPSGTAPSGGPLGGAPSDGAAPSGGPPSGAVPSGGPPGGGPPSGAAPSAGPPGGAAPSGGPPSDTPAGPPGGAPSSAGPPGGAADAPSTGGGKSTLQSEMLAEMERLRALMSGD
ncbi:MAG: hypothetical protein PVG65_00945 [Candidatus Thorarchaeota archaeon]|jgi:hypothetical protein